MCCLPVFLWSLCSIPRSKGSILALGSRLLLGDFSHAHSQPFPIPSRIHLLGIDSKPYMLFSFSSLIEFPTISSPIPSYEQVTVGSSHSQLTMPRVFAIAAYSKGFICSAGPGRVLLFEKMEGKDFYRESREIRVRRRGRTKTYWLLFSSSRVLIRSLMGRSGACSTEQQWGLEPFVLREVLGWVGRIGV